MCEACGDNAIAARGKPPKVERKFPPVPAFSPISPVHVIGAGLAGSEAAWTLANRGVPVILHEMRPKELTPAHKTGGFAELVCSNSFRSDDWAYNAVGLLHAEMRSLGSLVMSCADAAQVPAGAALAVDRDEFSQRVTAQLRAHPFITVIEECIEALPPPRWGPTIIATGPLTAAPLAAAIKDHTGEEELAFFDAIAPIVFKDSIDFSIAWMQSRYDKEGPGGDKAAYINCPLDKEQYYTFIDALLAGEKTEFKPWEKDTPYFEGCLPIEVMAERGRETLRFGPMKPVGLTDPRSGKSPYAVVQLRQDNAIGALWNMVGFQTKLKYGAQSDVFRLIPGLENAQFARLGGIHRNVFINSPKLLDPFLRLKSAPHVRFAGQITGVEGYIESAAMGLLAGTFAAREVLGLGLTQVPPTTALGALLFHVTGGHVSGERSAFQPMNVNFGLFPELDAPEKDANGKKLKGVERGRAKKKAMAERALADLARWRAAHNADFASQAAE